MFKFPYYLPLEPKQQVKPLNGVSWVHYENRKWCVQGKKTLNFQTQRPIFSKLNNQLFTRYRVFSTHIRKFYKNKQKKR